MKKISWPAVFKIWKQNEEKNPDWIKHYQQKGFKSWVAWRKIYIEPLNLDKLSWQIKIITDPLLTIPNFYGGPFKAWWGKFYSLKNKSSLTFEELAKLKEVKNNNRFTKLIKKFPKKTTLIALKVNKKIIIIEGMHRCTAIALIKQKNLPLKTNINLAFAEYPNIKLPILGI